MEQRDSDLPSVFLVKCIVSVYKFIILFYVVPKIWFGVDGNAGATSKKNLHVHDSFKKIKPKEQSQSILLYLYLISTPGEDSVRSV